MGSLNKTMVIGNIGKDPEIRYTQANIKVATLSVATNERWTDKSGEKQEETEWHRVVLWDKQADIAEKYLHKGKQVYIEGKLKTRSWEDDSGVKRYSTEIHGRVVVMLGSRDDGDGRSAYPGSYGAPQAQQQAQAQQQNQNPNQYNQGPVDDSDLPF